MKVPARVQYLVVVVLALAAIAFALPAMRDTPIEKFVVGVLLARQRRLPELPGATAGAPLTLKLRHLWLCLQHFVVPASAIGIDANIAIFLCYCSHNQTRIQ
jgi:hypothetical protein